jgi:hypothetical protein
MGLVQIEQSELDTLRAERDTARAETVTEKEARQQAERKVEEAEAQKSAAETERDTARTELAQKNEELARASLKEKRMTALGEGFTAKLGEFTKGRLEEQAKTLSDEEWDSALKEREELVGVKRDAEKDGSTNTDDKGGGGGDTTFGREELARLGLGGTGDPAQTGPTPQERSQVVGSLAGAFKPPKPVPKS